ncbi:c-type cytochrome [Taylorella equigenitalis]|uniref:c-type cytochrome n=1 Tax=Taylorella equigenitalis TaxID=29575 RepID=UPI00040E5E5F|nr:c-type cytochrome [Taylorella equigenitalis]WDU47730.1 c-type cytochrome [Taylorella equigenitalis]
MSTSHSNKSSQTFKLLVFVLAIPVLLIIILIRALNGGGTDPALMTAEAIEDRIAPIARYNLVESAPADDGPREPLTGEGVYKRICFSCHDAGLSGAPLFKDAGAWGPRIAKGKDTLFQHALGGFNLMPAKGGDAKLSDLEVQRGVVYMANQAGAGWEEPAAPATEEKPAEGATPSEGTAPADGTTPPAPAESVAPADGTSPSAEEKPSEAPAPADASAPAPEQPKSSEQKVEEAKDKAVEKTEEAVDSAKDKAVEKTEEAVDSAKDKAVEKTEEAVDSAKDKVDEVKEKATEKAEEAVDSAKEKYDAMKDAAGDKIDAIKESTSEKVETISQ